MGTPGFEFFPGNTQDQFSGMVGFENNSVVRAENHPFGHSVEQVLKLILAGMEFLHNHYLLRLCLFPFRDIPGNAGCFQPAAGGVHKNPGTDFQPANLTVFVGIFHLIQEHRILIPGKLCHAAGQIRFQLF